VVVGIMFVRARRFRVVVVVVVVMLVNQPDIFEQRV
jgi:hypothetical protein